MVINIKSVFKKIVLIGLILAPLNGIFASYELTFGSIVNLSTVIAPIWVKSIKDIVFGLCLILGIIGLLNSKWRMNVFLSFLFMTSLLLSMGILSAGNDYIYYLTGYRWALPFILIFLSLQFVDLEFLFKCSRILMLLFVIHFSLQILQLLFMQSFFYGLSGLGLSLRNPGFFLVPNTAGFFSISVLYFVLYFSDTSRVTKWRFLIITLISSYLTASGTALVAWFAVFSIWSVSSKNLKISILPIILLTVSVFMLLGVITGRGPEYITISLGIRMNIFNELLVNSNILSDKFGFGTSTAYLLGVDAIVTDSTFAGLLVNTGLIGFLAVFFMLILTGFKSWIIGSRPALTVVVILFMYFTTSSVSEAFPMNLLYVLVVAYFVKFGLSERTLVRGFNQSKMLKRTF